jgi:hypothetical protein
MGDVENNVLKLEARAYKITKVLYYYIETSLNLDLLSRIFQDERIKGIDLYLWQNYIRSKDTWGILEKEMGFVEDVIFEYFGNPDILFKTIRKKEELRKNYNNLVKIIERDGDLVDFADEKRVGRCCIS